MANTIFTILDNRDIDSESAILSTAVVSLSAFGDLSAEVFDHIAATAENFEEVRQSITDLSNVYVKITDFDKAIADLADVYETKEDLPDDVSAIIKTAIESGKSGILSACVTTESLSADLQNRIDGTSIKMNSAGKMYAVGGGGGGADWSELEEHVDGSSIVCLTSHGGKDNVLSAHVTITPEMIPTDINTVTIKRY